MKKKIIIVATITACLALCAAVSPRSTTVEKTSATDPMPAVTAPQPTLPEPKELATEKEKVEVAIAEPGPEVVIGRPPVPEPKPPAAENQTVIEPPAQPEAEPTPETEQESTNSGSENMVYVPGFGWIESQGPNHVEYAEDMYENGNKIGSMGRLRKCTA